MTEEQLLMRFIGDRPEFIEGVVERVIGQFVERLLNERRAAIEAAVEAGLDAALGNIATREFLNLFLESSEDDTCRESLGEAVREQARKRVSKAMRTWYADLKQVNGELQRLRDSLDDDNADWWKRGGS